MFVGSPGKLSGPWSAGNCPGCGNQMPTAYWPPKAERTGPPGRSGFTSPNFTRGVRPDLAGEPWVSQGQKLSGKIEHGFQ